MHTVAIIAHNTFREAIRDKILYNLVFFALLLIAFSYFLGELTMGENVKVMMDIGLAAISLFGVLIAIFVGIGLVYKELDKRTIFTILSKPIHRHQFLLGKFCGLAATLFVQTLLMTIFFYVVLVTYSGTVYWSLLLAIGFIYLELLVITAVAILFSSYSSPFMSALFTIGFFLVGRCTDQFIEVAKKSDNVVFQMFSAVLRYVDLNFFNFRPEVVHGVPILISDVVNAVGYALSLIFLLLLGAAVVFRWRDFK